MNPDSVIFWQMNLPQTGTGTDDGSAEKTDFVH